MAETQEREYTCARARARMYTQDLEVPGLLLSALAHRAWTLWLEKGTLRLGGRVEGAKLLLTGTGMGLGQKRLHRQG